LRNGLELRTNMVALNLVRAGRSIVAVDCVDRLTGEPRRFAGRQFVLAAGALASPHLLLSSGLDTLNPAGDLVGRFLMRHFNAVVMGVFPKRPEAELQFHKQIGIHDFYFGHPSVDRPLSRLGGIQQVGTPPADLVGHYLPPGVGRAVAGLLPHATGLLVIAEDQPRAENRVTVEKLVRDRYGLPELQICHRYSERDVFAGQVLIQKAKEILHEAGAVATYVQPIRTFSHAVGTARMGVDPRTSPLDAFGLFRGLDNLHLSDASCFPTSAAVNPSLTIAANALRVGNRVAGQLGRGDFVSLGRSA
jgi:choline dehydrogenase-like flavoprotein